MSLVGTSRPDARPRRVWRRRAAALLATAWLWLDLSSAVPVRAEVGAPEVDGARAPSTSAVVVLPTVLITPPAHPLDGIPASELGCRVLRAPSSVGAASLGAPNRGALFNGEQLVTGARWVVESPENAWVTPESARALRRAVEAVHQEHPGAPPLHLGDASREHGGYLRPHRSHQAGRDVDVGFFYRDGPGWYLPATAENLDRARTWSLLRALLATGEVEYVFLDQGVQALLAEHAAAAGEDPGWLAELFGGAARSTAPIRHTWGHRTHLHVRFLSPDAVETGLRLAPHLSPWNGRPTVPPWRCRPAG
ncbi:MAG TPA: penicillin-insensitive murein endopeptidase [Polyangiaceae bacterium]|nr:penicillin-insensitive murein endopeptidase [Polyangiaceae bacterium]